MPDVSSKSFLNEPLPINPYYEIIEAAIMKALASDSDLKTNPSKIKKLIFETNFFQDEYKWVIENKGVLKLEKFQKELKRGISCGINNSYLVTPSKLVKCPYMCKGRGCPHCGEYKASQYLNHYRHIIRYAIFSDAALALRVTRDIQQLCRNHNWSWLSVVYTPFFNGLVMVRVSNVREHDMNPLTEDNEVKASVDILDEFYNFDTCSDITKNDQALERRYLTGSGQVFTSTQLYRSRMEGHDVGREKGDNGIKYFDFEAGAVVSMTKKDHKKKQDEQDEEDGIIAKENVPGVNLQYVRRDTAINTLTNAFNENVVYKNVYAFGQSTPDDVRHLDVAIMKSWIYHLELSGHDQGEYWNVVRITQNDYEEFTDNYTVPVSSVPDNIMDLVFDEEDLGLTGKKLGMRELARTRQNQSYKAAQDIMKTSPTTKEVATALIDKMMGDKYT